MVFGSRLLNENGNFLGLNVYDLIGAVAILIFAAEALNAFALEILAAPLACTALVSLIPIRLRFRRKIIRDTLAYLLRGKGVYDPRQTS